MTKKIVLFVLLSATFQTIFSNVKLHQYASICPQSEYYQVSINEEKAFTYYTNAGSFVSLEADEAVEITITCKEKVSDVIIKPLRLGIEPKIDFNKITFKMPANTKVMLEVNDPINNSHEHLFIFSNPFQTNKPNADDPKVKFYKAGQIYDEGEIILKSDETLFIEAGAVVRGNVLSEHEKNITIDGYGVLDGGYYITNPGRPNPILIVDCNDVTINDIIMINPQAWTLKLYYTGNVSIYDVKQLTVGNGKDGIDIVTSKDVHIDNCMLSCGDDCVVVKAFKQNKLSEPTINTWEGTSNVLVENTILHAFGAQAFEIGHELHEPINNIVYRNCDVLAAHGQGGVFGIRNCDGGLVTNVLYENIRVDHYYNKLVDLRVIKSRYSRQEERGRIENVTFKDIYVTTSKYNSGYSISLIGGWDKDHKVKNITFDNFQLGGKKVTNGDELDLFIKQAEGIKFK